jgi:hypothetical protein
MYLMCISYIGGKMMKELENLLENVFSNFPVY